MARYIDDENFLALFDGVDLAETLPVGTIKILLHGVPTADVKPVVHAHWILHDDNNDIWDCSNCKAHIFINVLYGNKAKYCPNCGAIMDEEVE